MNNQQLIKDYEDLSEDVLSFKSGLDTDIDPEIDPEPCMDELEKDSNLFNSSHSNQDLRLVNDYFKEVGGEDLLRASEEVELAAKLRVCEQKLSRLRGELGKGVGGEYDRRGEGIEEQEIGGNGRGKLLEKLREVYERKGEELRGRFIRSNLRLVASMAKKYLGRGVPFLDLIQEGNLGLMRAVERYDHRKGYRFSTYACWWIKQAMTRGVFNQTQTVKVPTYVMEKAGKVRDARTRMREVEGREPMAEEIAKRVKMSVESVRQVMESGKGVLRLDSPVWNGEKATYMDYMADLGAVGAEGLIAEVSIPERVDEALEQLGEREREVVKMRFGIGYGGEGYTLDEIGMRFNLTRERIRQIEKNALTRLKRSRSANILKSLI